IYFYQNGIIQTNPIVGCCSTLQNNALSLVQPRVGIAWDPTGKGTWSIRAAGGMYNDMQDNILASANANPPFNGLESISGPLLNIIPLQYGTPPPPACNGPVTPACTVFVPHGVDPYMKIPTVIEWNGSVERQLTHNMSIQFAYIGSRGYHAPITVDT